MPMPRTCRQASRERRAFPDDVRDLAGLETDNLAYMAIQGVLPCFRRRLTPDTAIPATARALWRHVNLRDLARVPAQLPEGAVDFRSVPGARGADLAARIV